MAEIEKEGLESPVCKGSLIEDGSTFIIYIMQLYKEYCTILQICCP